MMQFEITRRNKNSAGVILVKDETGVRAMVSAGHQGEFDRVDQDALIEWLRKACEQFEAVNPDEPFPVATSSRRRHSQGATK